MRINFLWVSCLIASASVAEPASPDLATAIVERRAHMAEFNAAMQALGQQIMSKTPDRAIVVRQANRIHELAKEMPDWFPLGSGMGAVDGVDSAALPVIWEKRADFSARIAALSDASLALAEFAEAGDLHQLLGKATPVDRACVACHQGFRTKE